MLLLTTPGLSGCSGNSAGGDGSGAAAQVGGASGSGANSGTGGARALDCESLSEAESEGDRRCQEKKGYRVDENNQCHEEEPVYFGCHAPGCPASIHVAEDPSGELWLFSNGCTPRGWEVKHGSPVRDACEGAAGDAGGQGGAR